MTESEDFEYDTEDTEVDEGFDTEDSGETDEDVEDTEFYTGGEDVETDEGLDESRVVGAETDESEGIDESDGEVDEGLDEAVLSASARLRADRDRYRRAAWVQRNKDDLAREMRRASATQQAITRQIQSVRPGAQARVASVGPLRGAGVVIAELPNRRRTQMKLSPTLAPISEVNKLRRVIAINDRRQAIATSNNSRAITRLATAQSGAVKKLTAEQVKSDQELRKRLVEGDNRLDKRITKELSGGAGSLGKQGRQIMAQLKRQRQRQIWNNITLASSLPFWAAFGDRQLFGRNNLTLGISTLGWLLGDELVDSFRSKSSVVKGGANLWSYVAPVGNGATVFFLLRNRQHQRFISGVSELTGPGDHPVPVTANTTLFKKKAAEEFAGAAHSVVASFVQDGASLTSPPVGAALSAKVVGANLVLKLEGIGSSEKVKVAWIIDTKQEVSVNPTS
jgi:hypothetical protein